MSPSRGRGDRMRKVDETLREVVAQEISELKDPRIGFVTVTGVDTAPDLRTATVYYTVLGDEDTAASTQEGLEHAARRLQSAIARQVRLKYTPRLAFRVDTAVEHGLRINELLHRLEDEPGEDTGD